MLFGLKQFYRLFPVLFLTVNYLCAQPVWEKDSYKILLDNNNVQLFYDDIKIIDITSFSFNLIKPYSTKIEKVTPDSLILKLLFDEGDGYHDNFPDELLLAISQHNNTFHFTAYHESINHIAIELKDQDEHYFGLIEKLYPNNSKDPDLRGNVVDVDVYANGEQDFCENYASAYSAFYISSSGYGSFFDTFAKGRYTLGINGETEIYHQTGKLDWYVFYGPGGDIIHKEYYEVIGKPKYVPMWACGPIFWRDYNKGGKDEILDDIQKFTGLKIPLTACFVDRPYSTGGHEWSNMNFSNNFSEPEKWIRTIVEKYGMQFMTWVGSLTFTDKNFPGLFTDQRNYIDLTNPEALTEFEKGLNENQYSVGVKGHKMDRADEGFPLTAKWFEPVNESETRNKYVYLYSKVINDFLTKVHGKDQFNFARAAFHRSQPFLSAIWGGDNRPNWLGMSSNMANAIRASYQGFPVWGNDTGGYLGEGRIDEILYIRWLQWSAWNGMFEVKIDGAGGSGEDRPPWKYSEKLQTVYKNVCDTRMSLLPYIYSCINSSYKNGVMMKPLAYRFPCDKSIYSVWDEYIFGNAFLVAPIFSEDKERDIYLPEGKWFDLYDSKIEFTGPVKIHQKVSLENIPVFIKENSIYLTGDIFRGNSKIWNGELSGKENIIIHLFPGESKAIANFTYVDFLDKDIEKEMILINTDGKIIFQSPSLSTVSKIKIKTSSKPTGILLNGIPVEFNYSGQTTFAELECEKNIEIKVEVSF